MRPESNTTDVSTARWGVGPVPDGWARVRGAGRHVMFPLLLLLGGCGDVPGRPLANERVDPIDAGQYELLARFVHISDAQIMDEESPARLTAANNVFTGGFAGVAWRPHEAYSAQLLDGIIRTVNKLHVARHPIDFLIHSGDAIQNAQANEIGWFMSVLDGGLIDPLSGFDNRDPEALPAPLLDPHHPFEAQGLYRNGVHGDAPTIDWYAALGNHEHFASGVFPIVTDLLGHRTAPMPLDNRLGLFLPVELDPVGRFAWAPITPAEPGPPAAINFPALVAASTARRFITEREFVEAHLESVSDPPGHGFAEAAPGQTWYSVSPVPPIRLIVLDSSTPPVEEPGQIHSEGAVSFSQLFFLTSELRRAQRRGELVIVVTHHPADTLDPLIGTAVTTSGWVRLLNEYSCVKLHLAGHEHENLVIDRGGYVEIVTGSTLDAPQQGRVIEIWQDGDDVELRYWMFSHLDEVDPPDEAKADLFADPLMPMRRIAAELAGVGASEARVGNTPD